MIPVALLPNAAASVAAMCRRVVAVKAAKSFGTLATASGIFGQKLYFGALASRSL